MSHRRKLKRGLIKELGLDSHGQTLTKKLNRKYGSSRGLSDNRTDKGSNS